MKYISFQNLFRILKSNLYKIHSGNYDLIVGIPRSGMIPAYFIGLYLNKNITDLDSLINNHDLDKGHTRIINKDFNKPHDAKKILLVDDSISSGNSLNENLKKIPIHLQSKIDTLAVFATTSSKDMVSMYLEIADGGRIFEWNIFHRRLLEKSCVDIDGVLCIDPTPDQNDDGEKYNNFLINAKPHIVPSYKIHSLVTNRLEKYRSETVAWLEKHNIKYDNLVMLDLPSKEERQRTHAHVPHKASYYKKNTDLKMFIESSKKQAVEIMKKTGKPVYVVDTNEMINPDWIDLSTNNKSELKVKLKSLIAKLLPNFIKNIIKKFFKL